MSILIRAFLAIFFLSQGAFSQSPGLPATPKHPISNTHHGLTVTDDCRWLENWEIPQVKQWSAAENNYARHYLDHLPSRLAIVQRLQELTFASSASYFNLQFRGSTSSP
jgi:prolyl oligopeptidase